MKREDHHPCDDTAFWKGMFRDSAGFCLIALAGNPKCFAGDGRCSERDPEAAWDRIISKAARDGRRAAMLSASKDDSAHD